MRLMRLAIVSSLIDVMIDGEVLRCQPVSIDVLPLALDVIV